MWGADSRKIAINGFIGALACAPGGSNFSGAGASRTESMYPAASAHWHQMAPLISPETVKQSRKESIGNDKKDFLRTQYQLRSLR